MSPILSTEVKLKATTMQEESYKENSKFHNKFESQHHAGSEEGKRDIRCKEECIVNNYTNLRRGLSSVGRQSLSTPVFQIKRLKICRSKKYEFV